MVSDETYKTIIKSCDFYSDDTLNNSDCYAGWDELLTQYDEIDMYSLYTSVCITNSSSFSTQLKARRSSKMVGAIFFSLVSTMESRRPKK